MGTLTVNGNINMESNALEFISKKFAKIENVTTENATRDIQDHVECLG